MRPRTVIISIGFLLTAVLGYMIARTAAPEREKVVKADENAEPKRMAVHDEPEVKFRSGRAPASSFRGDSEATEAGALPGQRNLVFRDRAALEAFLKAAGDKIRILGRLDQLNALRVGFLNPDDLAGLLSGDEEASLVYPVDVPTLGEGSAQAGAVELGAGLLDFLGITGDHSDWGAGVKIAILDTGVAMHPAFAATITGLNMVDLPADLTLQNGHGTAVASVIIGNSALTPGVAPGAEIASIRIANDLGQSDSFLLAQGIVAAVDGGAQLINISMASPGDSALVRNAIEYARAVGALIIAASGNNGVDRISYPAANQGVIAVGAVDALGDHMAFSNSGTQLAVSAPGFGINAAWTGDQAAKVNGTSFSSPIVAGSIAAVMSQNKNMTASQAAELVFSYLNDTGLYGKDAATGGGTPDLGRVMNRDTRGIHDAAVAAQNFLPPSLTHRYGQMQVVIQNRGTETLVNTAVRINTPNGVVNTNITTLPVGGTTTVMLPVPYATASSISYSSSVSLSSGQRDSKPSNDNRSGTYAPVGGK